MNYSLSDFDYPFDNSKIALDSFDKRDHSKLLVFKDNKISDDIFYNLGDHLRAGDLLVMNNSKVIPARLIVPSEYGKIEIYLNKALSEKKWICFAKPAKKLVKLSEIIFADDFKANIVSYLGDGEFEIEFVTENFWDNLDKYALPPLPPYIAKNRIEKTTDKEKYQTVYAKQKGSVAAPTAGLHFTDELLKSLAAKDIDTAFVTLHVGAGTFLPVKSENILEHKMHSEFYEISQEAVDKINTHKKNGGRIIAVGTTSLRVLESVGKTSTAKSGDTSIFIYPSYKFQVVDGLITNFHLPKSTLLMLVAAFVGYENMKNIYQHALNHDYRFFSFGDTSLLWRVDND